MSPRFDQAATLRAWADKKQDEAACVLADPVGMPSVFAVGGGKGGVGKTVLCANLSLIHI